MLLANLAQKNNISHCVKYYIVSNRQDNSERKDSLKFLQNLAILVHLLMCYDSKLKVLSNELTLVLSDTRELDRVPSTK